MNRPGDAFVRQLIAPIVLIALSCLPNVARSQESRAQEAAEPWAQTINVGDIAVSLPAPSLNDSMNSSEQEAALTQVAGKYPLDRFLKDSIVAPLNLVRENLKDSQGERIGHQVDLWFVAYGSLDQIRDRDLLTELFQATSSNDESESSAGQEAASPTADSGQALTSEQLAARGLSSRSENGIEQNYYRFEARVIDKVLVQGVVQGITRSTEQSQLASMQLDERFREDKEFPNRWRHLESDADAFAPYGGLAGYAKATRLLAHPGAILVECHAVLHEPAAWFQGPNLLSSKLPLVTQDAVRSFRRKLGRD
jgi:hypothetical protein